MDHSQEKGFLRLHKDQIRVEGSQEGNSYGGITLRNIRIDKCIEVIKNPETSTKEEVAQAKETLAYYQKSIEEDMKALHDQFKVYSQAVNAENEKGKASLSVNKDAQRLKRQIENNRASQGRAQTTRSFILTHLALVESYDKIAKFKGSYPKGIEKDIASYERDYDFPKFPLNRSHLKEIFKTQYSYTTQAYAKANVQLGGQNVDVTVTRIGETESNPNNRGLYINFKLPGKLVTVAQLTKLNKNLSTKILPDVMKSDIKGYSRSSITNLIDPNIPLVEFGSISKSSFVEFNLVQTPVTKQFALQYMRKTDSIEAGASAEIPVAYGVTAVGGLSFSQSRFMSEKLGNNTLTYIMTLYDGYRDGNKGEPRNEDWLKTLEKHEPEFKKMFKNLADPSNNIAKESKDIFKSLKETAGKDKAEALEPIFQNAIKQYSKDPTALNYNEAVKSLNQLFDLNHTYLYKPEKNKAFRNRRLLDKTAKQKKGLEERLARRKAQMAKIEARKRGKNLTPNEKLKRKVTQQAGNKKISIRRSKAKLAKARAQAYQENINKPK